MNKKIARSIIAAAGVLGATMLVGCETKEPQEVYGVPSDIIVKSFNDSFSQYIGYNKDYKDVKNLIEKIEFENEYNAGKNDSTTTEEIVYPEIKYTGPSVDELDKTAFYIVKIEKYNESGIISEISVIDEMDI